MPTRHETLRTNCRSIVFGTGKDSVDASCESKLQGCTAGRKEIRVGSMQKDDVTPESTGERLNDEGNMGVQKYYSQTEVLGSGQARFPTRGERVLEVCCEADEARLDMTGTYCGTRAHRREITSKLGSSMVKVAD